MNDDDDGHDLMPKGNGWHMPPNSRKYHYFENSMSLCGRYGFMTVQGARDYGNYDSGDCAKCVKDLKKRTEKKEKEAN